MNHFIKFLIAIAFAFLLLYLLGIHLPYGSYPSVSFSGSEGVSFLDRINPSVAKLACSPYLERCSDGSYVERNGPLCDFAPCPGKTFLGCSTDADCPSRGYVCEGGPGSSTVCSHNACEKTIVNGTCRKKEGAMCSNSLECTSGTVCHQGSCTSNWRWVGNCTGPNDHSCPTGYICVQSCGPPVAHDDDPPAPYYCSTEEKLKTRMCPICLASNTLIAAPEGDLNVQMIRVGDVVWSLNKEGRKVKSTVVEVSSTPVPKSHQVVHVILSDQREVWVSPNHPTADGRVVGDLKPGDFYDGTLVTSAELTPYFDEKTYDILPDSDTGYYWANGILLKSTL